MNYAAVLLMTLFLAPPEVPKEPLKLKVGEDQQVTITYTKGKEAAYRAAFDSKDCTFFRGYETPGSGQMNFLVSPKRTGDFRVVFWLVGEGDSSVLIIKAIGSGPTPPPVDPVDPPPVDPTDPPVVPTDPLVAKIQLAYKNDPDPNKSGYVVPLAVIYRQGAKNVMDPLKSTTNDTVLATMRTQAVAMMGEQGMIHTRQAIRDELNAILPRAPNVTLDATARNGIASVYNRVATALEGVSK